MSTNSSNTAGPLEQALEMDQEGRANLCRDAAQILPKPDPSGLIETFQRHLYMPDPAPLLITLGAILIVDGVGWFFGKPVFLG